MMYVGSMCIQLKLYPEALGEMMMYFGSMYIQLTIRSMQQLKPDMDSIVDRVWFFNFCDSSQTGDYPQKDLAKFAYKPYVKVVEFKNPFIF